MEELKEYHNIVQKIWKLFKTSMEEVVCITDPQDPRWAKICNDFERIEKDAPPEFKRYVGNMVLLHVDELERKWRK